MVVLTLIQGMMVEFLKSGNFSVLSDAGLSFKVDFSNSIDDEVHKFASFVRVNDPFTALENLDLQVSHD
jgi:hypothetical protein